MATYAQASAQYESRFDAKCACGAPLWRSIEWAYGYNEKHKAVLPSTMWEHGNAGFIVIKQCKTCREKNERSFSSL